jgi:hypothetical protein
MLDQARRPITWKTQTTAQCDLYVWGMDGRPNYKGAWLVLGFVAVVAVIALLRHAGWF